MKVYCYTICLLYLALQIADSLALWWAVGRVPFSTDTKRICRKARRLKGPQQFRMCRKEQKMVQEIVMGARKGMHECQYQLRYHRWNCTTVKKSLGKMLLRDTRESAFVQSVTAGSVAHHVARECASGKLPSCSCKHHRLIDGESSEVVYTRRGCQDNVEFGILKSREFMDAERYRDARSKVLFHNNQVGRLAILRSVSEKCKCHGLSGSCALRTCYRQMGVFRTVGDELLEKFERARQVQHSNEEVSVPRDLIFTDQSPDFCARTNRRLGVLSPKGRHCNATEGSRGDCRYLCCDRGFRKVLELQNYNCRCSFRWCCEVSCDVCNVTLAEYRCK